MSWPTTAATKRSSNFKKKLLEMEAREEKKRLKEERKKLKEQKRLEKLERRAGRTSLDRRGMSPARERGGHITYRKSKNVLFFVVFDFECFLVGHRCSLIVKH